MKVGDESIQWIGGLAGCAGLFLLLAPVNLYLGIAGAIIGFESGYHLSLKFFRRS